MKKGTKLIFLYGPPGVGKLTVGKQLAKLTGFPLLHNQLVVDLLLEFFQFGTKPFVRIARTIRHDILRELAYDHSPGVIMTFVLCFSCAGDTEYIERLQRMIRSWGGTMQFVELAASEQVIFRRVTHRSRKKHRKIHSQAKLQALLRRHQFQSRTARERPRGTLVIRSDILTAKQAAEKIVRTFRLPRRTK